MKAIAMAKKRPESQPGGPNPRLEDPKILDWKFWEVEEMPRVSELSQVEAETQKNRFDEEVPYDDKLVNLLPNEAKVRRMTERQELRLKEKPELEKAVKDILSQQMEQGIIEVPEDKIGEKQNNRSLWSFKSWLQNLACPSTPSFNLIRSQSLLKS